MKFWVLASFRKERFTIIARVMWKVFFWVGPIVLIFPETFRLFVEESSTKSWKVSENEELMVYSNLYRHTWPGPQIKPNTRLV